MQLCFILQICSFQGSFWDGSMCSGTNYNKVRISLSSSKDKFTQSWKLTLSTHPHADGQPGLVFWSTKYFWSWTKWGPVLRYLSKTSSQNSLGPSDFWRLRFHRMNWLEPLCFHLFSCFLCFKTSPQQLYLFRRMTLFCSEAREMFCGPQNFPQLSISSRVSK